MPTIANFADLPTAQLAQSLLEAEGIEAHIPDEHMAGIDWRWSTALHGIRLDVAEEDVEAAKELLNENGWSAPEGEAAAAIPAPAERGENEVCPSCGGDCVEAPSLRRAKAVTMFFPIFLLFWPLVRLFIPDVACKSCGRTFRVT